MYGMWDFALVARVLNYVKWAEFSFNLFLSIVTNGNRN